MESQAMRHPMIELPVAFPFPFKVPGLPGAVLHELTARIPITLHPFHRTPIRVGEREDEVIALGMLFRYLQGIDGPEERPPLVLVGQVSQAMDVMAGPVVAPIELP